MPPPPPPPPSAPSIFHSGDERRLGEELSGCRPPHPSRTSRSLGEIPAAAAAAAAAASGYAAGEAAPETPYRSVAAAIRQTDHAVRPIAGGRSTDAGTPPHSDGAPAHGVAGGAPSPARHGVPHGEPPPADTAQGSAGADDGGTATAPPWAGVGGDAAGFGQPPSHPAAGLSLVSHRANAASITLRRRAAATAAADADATAPRPSPAASPGACPIRPSASSSPPAPAASSPHPSTDSSGLPV